MAEEITLVDILPGAAEAVALDLLHASGVNRSGVRLGGGSSMSLLAGADVIVVSAGRPRTPGMTRTDLMTINGRAEPTRSCR